MSGNFPTAEGPDPSRKLIGVKRSIAQAAAALLTAAGLTVALPASASATAPRCRGYECDAKYASATGCDVDAYVPRREGAKITTGRGVLQVYWGPKCSTNWGVFEPTAPGSYRVLIYRQDVGHEGYAGYPMQRRVVADEIPIVQLRTRMFYAPVAPVKVCVDVPAGGRVSADSWTRYACTEWI
ncbi:hypothetical protein GCM10023334_098590 [Nonomuraea thailandensis]